MKAGETKNTAFRRLAAGRTNNILRNIRLLGNLSNRNNYNYSEEDFRHIFSSIENELKLAKSRFLVAISQNKKFKL